MIAIPASVWPEGIEDLDALTQLQELLLMACTGMPAEVDGQRYQALRNAMLTSPEFQDLVPPFVRAARDMKALVAHFARAPLPIEGREASVRASMQAAIERARGFLNVHSAVHTIRDEDDTLVATAVLGPVPHSASAWTGITSLKERAVVARSLLPASLSAVEALIEDIQMHGHNGGPALDGREDVLETLERLHTVLGELLDAAKAEQLGLPDADGLVGEAIRLADDIRHLVATNKLRFALVATIGVGCWVAGGGFPVSEIVSGLLGASAVERKRG